MHWKDSLPDSYVKKYGNQPCVNIGTAGHVDHGKTTLTQALTGKWTSVHSQELKRGITIRVGYSDAAFYKCKNCEPPLGYSTTPKCPNCKKESELSRVVSFVDSPGHESLMANMMSGSALMDGAILVVAANEQVPKPQTREHLMGLQIAGIKNIVIVQNKIDLVTKERAMRNYKQIQDFLKGTDYESAPIIPLSAQKGVNISFLLEAIEKHIPTPKRVSGKSSIMFVARSFDINKPGSRAKDLKGGVIGGAMLQGEIKVGDRIEIKPGRVVEEQNKLVAKPLFAKITSCMTGSHSVDSIHPGGSVAIMTTLDSSVVSSDKLVGSLVGLPETLPPVWTHLTLQTKLLDKVIGSDQDIKVDPRKSNEIFMLNVNSAATVGFVEDISKNQFKCRLKKPICAEIGSKVTISRRIGTRFRLIGFGSIKD